MRPKLLFGMFVAASLSACATQYSRDGMGIAGGVEAQMITNDTARISALGNGFTDKARINDFVLLKAAETASAQGFTHFAILGSEDASSVSSYTTPGTMQTSVYGHSAVSTYTPGISSTIVKPGADVMVRFCGKDNGNPCTGMLPANEVIQNLGPKYLPKN